MLGLLPVLCCFVVMSLFSWKEEIIEGFKERSKVLSTERRKDYIEGRFAEKMTEVLCNIIQYPLRGKLKPIYRANFQNSG